MSAQHTPGPWANSRRGAVTSSAPIPGITGDTGHADTEYYGGYLICESIYRIEDARLIAAAPDLLAACQRLLINVRWDAMRADIITDEARADIALAETAIAKATEAA